MWAIRCIDTERYYEGDTFSMIYDDYMPQWSSYQDTSKAMTFKTKEAAERWMESTFAYPTDLEVVEI